MTFLIVHGIGGHSGIHWQNWLKAQLEMEGHVVIMPTMPNSEHPNRQKWLEKINESLENENIDDVIIIGHSLGVTAALDYIEVLQKPIFGLVSVSGFASDYGAELNSYYMKERSINFDKVRQHVQKCIVFYGDDDPYVAQRALIEVANKLGVVPHIISKGGHLNSETGFVKFPELLELIRNELV